MEVKQSVSQGLWKIPTYLGGVRRTIMFYEISLDIPLLISLPCLKKLRMIIDCKDCKRDKALIEPGVHIKLHRIEHGGTHYWVSLLKEDCNKDVLVSEKVFVER